MKRTAMSLMLLAACCFIHPGFAQSQKEETIILKQEPSHPQTVIEIRDGRVWVNGTEVAGAGDLNNNNFRKKIIIDGQGDMPAIRDMGPVSPLRPKALLGVMTAAAGAGNTGARVERVSEGSPAEQAGLRQGDVITKVNDKTIENPADLSQTIGAMEAGAAISITYNRDGKSKQAKATLEAAPEPEARAFRFGPGAPGQLDGFQELFRRFNMEAPALAGTGPELGVTAEDRADGKGVRIEAVKPGSAAATAGLKAEDILLELDGQQISSVRELQQSLRGLKTSEAIKLKYQRSGKTHTAELTFPRKLYKRDL